MNNYPAIALNLGDITVRQHNGLFSLNDLHKASGGNPNQRPGEFIRNQQTKELVEEISNAGISAFESRKGSNGGTYACRELVIAYAAWISAAFHLKVIRVFLAAVQPQRPHNQALDYDRISPAQAQDLKELVHAVVDAKVQGFGETWARLHKRFRVNSYLELPATRFAEARDYLLGKLPEQDRAGTVNELVAEWVRKIEAPNGYPASLFQPIVDAVQRKLGHQLPPGKMMVDRQKLAAVWSDLGKLRNRIDGLGMLESDLPPSWWRQQQISA